jgi:hypothetical protein
MKLLSPVLHRSYPVGISLAVFEKKARIRAMEGRAQSIPEPAAGIMTGMEENS